MNEDDLPDGTPSGDESVNFRVETLVTYVNNEDGTPSPAKRVTVVSQWAAVGGATLTGDCSQVDTECSIQSMVRAPDATDVDPTTGESAKSLCAKDAQIICEAYIRSGRVLDGSTMATTADAPEQVSPVDLYVHTASEATSVVATWSWSDTAGSTVQNISHALVPTGADTTRWTYEVPADVDAAGAVHKGEIRAGAATVRFTAVMGAAPVIRDVPSFWSYSLKRARVLIPPETNPANAVDVTDDGGIQSLDHVNVVVTSAAGPCTPGTPVDVNVRGLSLGFSADTKNAGAADTVDVSFTTATGTITVPAVVNAGSVVAHNATVQGLAGSGMDVIGGWVEADWTAPLPAGVTCAGSHAVVTVHRAADQSTTPVFVTLP